MLRVITSSTKNKKVCRIFDKHNNNIKYYWLNNNNNKIKKNVMLQLDHGRTN